MNWFEKHLNWTWVIGFVFITALMITVLYFGIFAVMPLPAVLWLVFGMWVLSCKNRSGWWIVPTYIIPFIPLLLKKVNNEKALQ